MRMRKLLANNVLEKRISKGKEPEFCPSDPFINALIMIRNLNEKHCGQSILFNRLKKQMFIGGIIDSF